jgi:hypothetical protein
MDQRVVDSLKVVEHKLEYLRNIENLLEKIATLLAEQNKETKHNGQVLERMLGMYDKAINQSQPQQQRPF